jgi:hypothetical protein
MHTETYETSLAKIKAASHDPARTHQRQPITGGNLSTMQKRDMEKQPKQAMTQSRKPVKESNSKS